MKILNIVSTAYRATLEEQDDTVLWLSQSLRRAGGEVDLLLRGAAANYLVDGQHVAPLAIGGRAQRNAPAIAGQIEELRGSGAEIFVFEPDLDRYGLRSCPGTDQARPIGPAELGRLLSAYDAVWHW
jgi:hypothetical protein